MLSRRNHQSRCKPLAAESQIRSRDT